MEQHTSINRRPADKYGHMQAVVDAFGTSSLASLWTAFRNRAAEADSARSRSDDDWWKGYESALAIVGAASEDLLEHVEETSAQGRTPSFDLGQVFTSVVPTYLTAASERKV